MVSDSLDSSLKKVDPLVWIEGAVETTKKQGPSTGKLNRLLYGSLMGVAIPSLVASITSVFLWVVRKSGFFVSRFTLMWLLISSIPVIQVNWLLSKLQRAFEESDLDGAQHALADLTGRDQSNQGSFLDLRSEAIKSLGDTMVRECVGPCFYYVLFGVPGILAYRTILIIDQNLNRPAPSELGVAAKLLRGSVNFIPVRISRYFIVFSARLIEDETIVAIQGIPSDNEATERVVSNTSSGSVGVDSDQEYARIEDSTAQKTTSEQVGRFVTLIRVASALVLLATFLLSLLSVGSTRRK